MDYSDIRKTYIEADKKIALFAFKLKSHGPYEGELFIPTLKNRAAMESELYALQEMVKKLPAGNNVNSLFKTRFEEFLNCTEFVLGEFYYRPLTSFYSYTYACDNLVSRDSRDAEVRAELLLNRYSQINDVWSAIREWLGNAPSSSIREIIGEFKELLRSLDSNIQAVEECMSDLHPAKKQEVIDVMRDVSLKMQGWSDEAAAVLALRGESAGGVRGLNETVKFEESYYRKILTQTLGVNLDELLSWYEESVESTREECFRLAASLELSERAPKTMKEVADLIAKHSSAASSPKEMFERAERYVQIARNVAHDCIWLPEDETCSVKPLPKRYESSYPWGAYMGGCSRRRPLHGEMVLNAANYKNISDSWLKSMAVHEGYPGHHAQFIRTTLDPIPETLKMYVMATPLKEGTAHRSEIVFKDIFDDPIYPLFVAYRMHHTAVRVKADLYLRYYGKTIGDTVKLYMDEMGFDENSARGQVQAQENMQGFFTAYYYGLTKLAKIEAESKLDQKNFTKKIFCAGDMSLNCFDKFIKLNDAEAHEFANDYASLIEWK